MPSPFPGMDPYLEPHWLDVHTTLVTECRRVMNRRLPDDLIARSEERVAVESEVDEPVGRIGPDVRVFAPAGGAGGAAALAVIDAPFRIKGSDDPIIERFIRIVDAHGQLVTVVEFVSPTNKRRPGLARFRRNRRDLLRSGVHVVEVDLVRAGNWRSLMRPDRCSHKAAATYRTVVRVAGEVDGYLFPMSLRQPLPDVPIPLRPGDGRVTLPLQDLLTTAYDDGRYSRTIDYSSPPDPPLRGDDAVWAASLVG